MNLQISLYRQSGYVHVYAYKEIYIYIYRHVELFIYAHSYVYLDKSLSRLYVVFQTLSKQL